jgi:threonine dehydrogenase-like Zn-dependent dehydrogenase
MLQSWTTNSKDYRKGVEVVLDCVGTGSTISGGAYRILNKAGALVVVGMLGSQVRYFTHLS